MFKNKKILILGFARSGYETAKILINRNNTVILNDSKDEDKHDASRVKELRDMGVEFVFGGHPDDLLDESFDYLIKNPGVPIDHKYVLKARELGIEVINEVEMAYRLIDKDIKIVSITGTNGKTTTTTLTYNLLKNAYGDRVHLAGNIGYPLCSVLNDLKDNDILVMEVSCQQLENMSTFHPNVALMTNLSPAHIDFLKSYENYKRVKCKLFANQDKNDVSILNIENDDVIESNKNLKSNVKYFSSKKEINGCYLKDNDIYYYGEKVMSRDDIFIAGMHNVENCMAAIMIAKEFGVTNDIIVDTISSFRGVEHRLEYVGRFKNIKFYNDSIATAQEAVINAVKSINDVDTIIIGGMDRGLDYTPLAEFLSTSSVQNIILLPATQERIKCLLEKYTQAKHIFCVKDMEEAVKMSYKVTKDNKTCLLSPAAASYGFYLNFEKI